MFRTFSLAFMEVEPGKLRVSVRRVVWKINKARRSRCFIITSIRHRGKPAISFEQHPWARRSLNRLVFI